MAEGNVIVVGMCVREMTVLGQRGNARVGDRRSPRCVLVSVCESIISQVRGKCTFCAIC